MWSSRLEDRSALSRLLAPLSIEDFQEQYYERAPLLISGRESAYYDRYFSLREFERVMCGCELRTYDVNVVKDGTPARADAYIKAKPKGRARDKEAASDIIDPDRLSAMLAGGCSLVLDAAAKFSPSLAVLTRELEMFFRHRVNPNVYFTPSSAQGFAVHYDTHDTLIIQVAGTKHWRVYNSALDLPLDDQYYDKRVHALGPVSIEAEVKPGDLLYIPRGVLHEARATDEVSLHVTLGLYPARWIHVLDEALRKATLSEVLLRKTTESTDDERIREFLNALVEGGALETARQSIQSAFEGERRNGLDGQIEQMVQLKRLSDESIVEMRPALLYRLSHDEKSTSLTYSGKTLTFGPGAAALIQELAQVKSATVQSLLKHDEGALKIVRRLIQEGFVIQLPAETAGASAVA